MTSGASLAVSLAIAIALVSKIAHSFMNRSHRTTLPAFGQVRSSCVTRPSTSGAPLFQLFVAYSGPACRGSAPPFNLLGLHGGGGTSVGGPPLLDLGPSSLLDQWSTEPMPRPLYGAGGFAFTPTSKAGSCIETKAKWNIHRGIAIKARFMHGETFSGQCEFYHVDG